jgi:uncharacterized repeat protein (TIGR01451 family)
MAPLLIVTLALVLSFSVNDVAAANSTSNNVIVSSQDVSSAGQVANTQTTVQSKAKTNSSKTNKTSNSPNTKTGQKIADPQIYNNGAPVARGGHPAGYIYTSIAAAITDAHSGDTIMLENGATFFEHGLIIAKNLNFNVFNNGYATIDGQNLGTVFIISKGVTAHFRNLIITHGKGISGGGIRNDGTLTVTNSVFRSNSATNGGAIYNGGTLTYDSTTHTGETIGANGGTLTVNNSTFTGNTATKNGGAIFNGGTINITTSTTLTDYTITQNGGTLVISKSIFTGNTAGNDGGAIANDATLSIVDSSTLTRTIVTKNGGTVTITSSTFIGNKAINGGAVSNVANFVTRNAVTLTGPATSLNTGTVTITDSVIMGNRASNRGGALYNAAITSATTSTFTDYLINNVATITATFSTMAGNTAQSGGALYNNAVSTVTQNSLTSTTLLNTATASVTDNALVDNYASTGRDIVNNVVTTQNNNVFVTSPIPANTGTVNAINNWWGSVTGPSPGDVVGTVAVNPYKIYSMNSTITASNSSPNVGQQFHYTITVTNNGPDSATDVQLTNGLPAGLTFNGYTASQGTYTHATNVWNIGTLASGASAVLQLFVTPTASVAGTLVTKNVTLVNTNTTESTNVTVPSTPTTIGLTKTASTSTPNVGQRFHYTLIVTNNGSTTATGVQVVDHIPAGLTFNSYTASQGTYNSATGIWNVGTLISGAVATLQLFVTPTASVAGTTVINTATTAGQSATAPISVPLSPVPVVLTKTVSTLVSNVGHQFHYILTVRNNGPNTATNVRVNELIPAGLTFNSYTATQGIYNHITGVWTVGTLLNGASAVLRIFVTPTASVAGETVVNSASTTGQVANAAVFVNASSAANVVLTKTASTSIPRVGQRFHYTLNVRNNGSSTATGIRVMDLIHSGLIYNGYTATQGTYNRVTGIWNVGTLVGGASAFLRIFVTPTASVVGTNIVNTATLLNTGQNSTTTVHVRSSVRNNGNSNNSNTETGTIGMQHTGVPFTGIIAAILLILGGTIIPRIKK